jgi:hypothetical protein
LGFVARELELSLREGGYSQQRWYPIGMGSGHGFAVTTRLEQLEDDGRPSPSARWSSLYADAANLRWLMQARTPRLPHPGHYRVLLFAYTDLSIDKTGNAPIWNQETIMDWPNAPHASAPGDIPVSALAPCGYRLAIYEYEYEYRSNDTDDRGKLLPRHAETASGKSPPVAAPLEARGFTLRAAGQF